MTVKKNVYELFVEIEAEEAALDREIERRVAEKKTAKAEKAKRDKKRSRILGALYLLLVNIFYGLILVIGFYDIGGLASVAFLAVFLPAIVVWDFKKGISYIVL